MVYTYYIFFIHSSVEGHLGCFHVLTIVNNVESSLLGDPLLPDPSHLVISYNSLLVVPKPHTTLPSPCSLLRPWFQPMWHIKVIMELHGPLCLGPP